MKVQRMYFAEKKKKTGLNGLDQLKCAQNPKTAQQTSQQDKILGWLKCLFVFLSGVHSGCWSVSGGWSSCVWCTKGPL